MKVTLIVFVVFVATKQISSEEETKAKASNETTASNKETTPTSMFKNIADFFKNIVPIRKKNDSSLNRENSTTSHSIEDLSIHNTTRDHFANSSAEVNSTSGIVKLKEVGSNTTNVSTENITEYENKKLKENSTIDDSLIHNATQEHLPNTSTIEDGLSNITASSEGPNQYATTNRRTSNSETIDESTNIYPDDDSSSPEKDVTIAPELDTTERTEISELSKLDPEQHQNYCKSYIDKLLTATFIEYGDQLDPLILEDRKIAIENTFLHSSLRGEVGLYDGKVTGMSKAISLGECNVQIRDDQVRLKSTLSFDEAEMSYKGRAIFLEFGPKIIVNGKFSGSLVELQIVVPKDGGIGQVNSVRVRNVGTMDVKMKGLGPINWALGFISEDIARAFSLNFRRALERELRGALEEEIRKINYP